MTRYLRGALAQVDADIRNQQGVLADPTSLKLCVRKPDGTVSVYEWKKDEIITRTNTGQFNAKIDLSEAGSWEYRWEATGAVQVPGGGVLLVDPSSFDEPSTAYTPTAADIRRWSKVDFDDLDFEIVNDTDPLERVVQRSILWLQVTTGRLFSLLKIPDTKEPEETDTKFAERVVEAEWMISSMQLAAQMLVEYAVYVAQPGIVETAADFNQIASFSAGSYSETRRPPNSRTRAIHPWTDLADLLNDLMTDEKRSLLIEGPAMSTDAPPRWDVGREIMGESDRILTPFGAFVFPWDLVGATTPR